MDQFKFPDEVDNQDNEVEVEIIDDTPEHDRDRTPMPKAILDELDTDELEEYSEAAKQRLKQMRKVYHDERREKEAAVREQQEAIRYAQQILDENKKLRATLTTGEKEYVSTLQSSAKMELDLAKRAFKEAYEQGDADLIIEAQQALQQANYKAMEADRIKLPPLQEFEDVVKQPQIRQQANPVPDSRALAWQERNPWFGQDPEMTASALGLHEKLKANGVIVGSDEYYTTLDNTMRRRFSENFDDPPPAPAKPKPQKVVAPAVRTTASKTIRLTATQLQFAKKLGVTPEQYYNEVKRLESINE